jgi:hypothetical protein
MGLQLTLGDITSAFAHTYESIDVRTVASLVDGHWRNIITVVRFSHLPVEAIEARYKDLRQRNVHPANEVFSIFLSALLFAKSDEFLSGFPKAEIRHTGCIVLLNRPMDLKEQVGYVARNHGTLRNIGGDWPSCEISLVPDNQQLRQQWDTLRNRLGERRLTMQMSRYGYSSSFDAVDAFLEFGRPSAQRYDLDLHVAAPLLGKIESVSVSSDNPRIVTATARIHQQLPDPALSLAVKDVPFQYSGGLLQKATLQLSHETKSEENGIRLVEARAALPPSSPLTDYVDIKLTCAIGEIDNRDSQLRKLVPFAEVSPLYNALTLFCSSESFKTALTLAHSFSLPKKRQAWQQQDYFERHVCWLLSCFGFACIMLAEYETLRSGETAIQRGSVDILAFHPKRSLLMIVACTLNAPKEEDFHNLLNIRDILENEAFAESPQQIVPAVFTAVRNFPGEWGREPDNPFSQQNSIPVLDALRLDAALGYLSARTEEKFWSLLFLKPAIDFY